MPCRNLTVRPSSSPNTRASVKSSWRKIWVFPYLWLRDIDRGHRGALTIARWRVVALVVGVLWGGAILSGFAFNLALITLF